MPYSAGGRFELSQGAVLRFFDSYVRFGHWWTWYLGALTLREWHFGSTIVRP